MLLLLLLGVNTIDCLPGIFSNARVACIGALDDVNTILQKRPWVRSATTIAKKWEALQCAVRFGGPFVLTAVTSHSLLSLACIDLSRESLIAADCLAGNGPDVVVVRFGMDGRLERFLEDLPLVGGYALLQFSVVREVSAKAGKEA